MDYPVHVQVEVIKLHTIRIREASVHRKSFAIYHILLQEAQRKSTVMMDVALCSYQLQ